MSLHGLHLLEGLPQWPAHLTSGFKRPNQGNPVLIWKVPSLGWTWEEWQRCSEQGWLGQEMIETWHSKKLSQRKRRWAFMQAGLGCIPLCCEMWMLKRGSGTKPCWKRVVVICAGAILRLLPSLHTGSSALWPESKGAPQTTSATSLLSWTQTSQLQPSSTLSPGSCLAPARRDELALAGDS